MHMGEVKEIGIWSIVLTEDEIRQLQNGISPDKICSDKKVEA